MIILLCFPARGQEVRGPKLVLEEREFDFGEVKEGKVVEHTFRLFNKGDQPLKIVRVKPG